MKISVAVDLDGTLAEYDEWIGNHHIGKVVEPIKEIVIAHLANGDDVSIFTSRVSEINEDSNIARRYIEKWLDDNGFPELEITCVKHKKFKIFYDDRAIQVERNTGVLVSGE